MAECNEIAGMGVGIEIEESLSADYVWEVLCDKVQRPQDYLPVCNVITRVSDDGKGISMRTL